MFFIVATFWQISTHISKKYHPPSPCGVDHWPPYMRCPRDTVRLLPGVPQMEQPVVLGQVRVQVLEASGTSDSGVHSNRFELPKSRVKGEQPPAHKLCIITLHKLCIIILHKLCIIILHNVCIIWQVGPFSRSAPLWRTASGSRIAIMQK